MKQDGSAHRIVNSAGARAGQATPSLLYKVVVCHVATVHTGLDVRIYHKQMLSLSRAGYECHMVISTTAEEAARAETQGVRVHLLNRAEGQSRLARMFFRPLQALRLIRGTGAQIVHFHDPELMPLGILLRMMGRQVIMDCHEFLPDDILTKEWLPASVRKPLAGTVWMVQKFVAARFAAVVAATPHIGDRFRPYARRCVTLNNFPVRAEIETAEATTARWEERKAVTYAGTLTAHRCIQEMVDAAARVQVPLILAGNFPSPAYREAVRRTQGWPNVIDLGQVEREQVLESYRKSFAGIVLWAPIPNFLYGVPNKLLEYMGAGLPVVASNLPGMKDFVLTERAGLCVDPYDVEAIAEAIAYLRDNPDEAREMGQRGLEAVRQRYNWDAEEKHLLLLYQSLSGATR